MLFKINLNMLGSAETCFVNLMAKKGHSAATRIFFGDGRNDGPKIFYDKLRERIQMVGSSQ